MPDGASFRAKSHKTTPSGNKSVNILTDAPYILSGSVIPRIDIALLSTLAIVSTSTRRYWRSA